MNFESKVVSDSAENEEESDDRRCRDHLHLQGDFRRIFSSSAMQMKREKSAFFYFGCNLCSESAVSLLKSAVD